ncbi:hypothetical protein L3Q82_015585, partial [Scortum barcoo]
LKKLHLCMNYIYSFLPCSPLLGNQFSGQPQEGTEHLSPNLRPRHQELIPTPCGPIKQWSELSCLIKLYFCFTIASLLVLLGLTGFSIYRQCMDTDVSDEDNVTVSLILLVGILFCIYYIARGVLQENRQELVVFVLSVLAVMVRSVVNFSVLGSKSKQEVLMSASHLSFLHLHTPSLNRHLTVVEGFVCPNDPRSYVVGGIRGITPLVGSPHGKQVLGDGARLRAVHKTTMENEKTRTTFVARIGVTGAPPWSQAWVWGSLKASAWCPVSPEMATWARLPVGSPPTGRSMRGRCNVVWVAVGAGGLGRPNPWTKTLAIGTWNVTSLGGKEPAREVERYRLEKSGSPPRIAWALEPSSLRGAGPSTTLELPRFVHNEHHVSEHKGVHHCMWHQDTLGRRSMIDFVVVSSDLRPYVLDTRVKRGAELSTDHHLVVELDPLAEEEVGQTWQTQTYCEGLLGTSGRALCQGGLQLPPSGRASHRFRGRLGTLSPSGPCSLPPLSTRQFEVVDARSRSLVPVVAATPPNPVVDTGIDRYRQAKLASRSPDCPGGKNFGSGRSSVRPWRRTIGRPRRDSGKLSNGASERGKSLDVVGLFLADTPLQHCMEVGGTVPLEWQTGVVVPLFKKGDRRVCSNCTEGSHFSASPGRSTPGYAVGVIPDRRGEEGAGVERRSSRFTGQSTFPHLTYGHELWVMTERIRSRIQAAEMSFLRRVAGRSLRDRVRSFGHFREELGVEPLLLHIERSQLRWLGHLFRMPPGRLPREVFQACPTGRRPRGRPRTRWRDYVSRLAWERLGSPRKSWRICLGRCDLCLSQVRFVCIMCLGIIHVLCTMLLIQRPNMMAFRVGGALESLQEQYFLLNLCFSMVTFDLQAQLCLCILITTLDSAMSVLNSIILGVGVVWACLTAAVGAVAVLKEAKVLVWVFMVQNLPQLALFVYLMYMVGVKWFLDSEYTLEAATVTGALISLVIKVVLFWGLIRLVHSFGQGLRERSEYAV